MLILVSVEKAIERLNTAVQADRAAIDELLCHRVPCSVDLANHPTVQVAEYGDSFYKVGLLGIINGIFGTDSMGNGYIAARFDDDGKLVGFERFRYQDGDEQQ